MLRLMLWASRPSACMPVADQWFVMGGTWQRCCLHAASRHSLVRLRSQDKSRHTHPSHFGYNFGDIYDMRIGCSASTDQVPNKRPVLRHFPSRY